MSVLAAEGIPPGISFITGPTMLGILLNWGFMGVLAAQIYFYHVHFPEDRLGVKLLVYGLAILDVAQTVLITADAFHWFVYNFGDAARLDDTFLNSWDVPLMDGVISLIVQAFYCWRIYFLRKNVWVPGAILAISVTQCVAAILTAVRAHELGQLHLISTDPHEVVVQTIWLVGAAVADVAIAATLAWVLLRRSSSPLPQMRSLISRVVRITVETNALTAGIAVLSLIIFWAVPQHATLVVPPTSIIGKLYTNCLVAVLNNRIMSDAYATRRSTSTGHRDAPQSVSGRQRNPSNGNALESGVKVHVVREMTLDASGEQEVEMSWMSMKHP